MLETFEGEEYEGALLYVTLSVNNFAFQSIEEIDPVDWWALLGSAGGVWGKPEQRRICRVHCYHEYFEHVVFLHALTTLLSMDTSKYTVLTSGLIPCRLGGFGVCSKRRTKLGRVGVPNESQRAWCTLGRLPVCHSCFCSIFVAFERPVNFARSVSNVCPCSSCSRDQGLVFQKRFERPSFGSIFLFSKSNAFPVLCLVCLVPRQRQS